MNFTELDLHPDLLDGLEALRFEKATPVQEQAIPIILEGRDLIACAQTGTGKTAAFMLPVISEILDSRESGFVQALVIVPTRELAGQIDQVVDGFSYFTGVSSISIYGGSDGKSFARERQAIESGADILVVTPGRFIAHINLGYVKLDKLRFLILDEADRMLDMGFLPDLQKIFNILPAERQTLLFSATMPPEIRVLTKKLLKDPATITLALSKPAAGVTQGIFLVREEQKIPLMVEMLKNRHGQRIIVFASTKLAVQQLFKSLRAKKLNVEMISSDLEQADREKVMNDFRARAVDVLVATDVLSRGIDVDNIEAVINFDVPNDAEDYVHRIGRTARAEKKGEAFTLVSPKDSHKFVRIEKLIERKIDRLELPPGIGPMASEEEIFSGRGGQGGPRFGGRGGGGGSNFSKNQGPRPPQKGPSNRPPQNQQQNSQPRNPPQNHAPRPPQGENQAQNGENGEAAQRKKRRRNRGRGGNGQPRTEQPPAQTA